MNTQTQATNSNVYTDFQGLAKLRASAKKDADGALHAVAHQFESLFMQMMLKSMRDASIGDSLFGSSQMDMYRDISDKQLAIDLSKKGGLGIADMLIKQIRNTRSAAETGASEGDGITEGTEKQAHGLDDYRKFAMHMNHTALAQTKDKAVASGKSEDTGSGKVQAVAQAARDKDSFNDPVEFVSTVLAYAMDAGKAMGFAPEILAAQAVLETGWGQHIMQHKDGRSSNNLFGIKADSRWNGDRIVSRTIEFRDGVMRKETASFRSYGSIKESIADYLDFLRTSPRYQEALQSSQQPEEFAEHLYKAGYATDPEYAEKIKRILSSDLLKNARREAGI